MSKKLKQGKCIHCLKWTSELTEDHVLPRSWYVLTVPSNEEKWTAPSCRLCNGSLGQMENDLFIKLALCLNITNDYTKAIRQRVMDMLNPDLTKDFIQKQARLKKIKELLADTRPGDGSREGLFPNFDYHDGYDPKIQRTMPIPKIPLQKFGEKLIKGIEYNKSNRYIDAGYSLEVIYAHPETIRDVTKLIHDKRWSTHHYHPQGFEFYRALPPQGFPIIYQVKIWDRFEVFGTLGKTGEIYE